MEGAAGPTLYLGNIGTQLGYVLGIQGQIHPSVHASEGPALGKVAVHSSFSDEEDQSHPRRRSWSWMSVSQTNTSQAIICIYASGRREAIHHPERQAAVLEHIGHCCCL